MSWSKKYRVDPRGVVIRNEDEVMMMPWSIEYVEWLALGNSPDYDPSRCPVSVCLSPSLIYQTILSWQNGKIDLFNNWLALPENVHAQNIFYLTAKLEDNHPLVVGFLQSGLFTSEEIADIYYRSTVPQCPCV